jgi:branched-chain amino acid aminotransferase
MERSNGTLYGKGIFTTVAVRDSQPILWKKHWRRLIEDATSVGLDLSIYNEDFVLARIERELSQDGINNGRARITFIDRRSSELWPDSESEEITDLQIIVGEVRPAPSPFRLTISPYPVNSGSPLAGVKSCNYLEQILAKDEAKGRGFHEAIRVNERGLVTSACMANVFWLKDGRLYTPALSTGCLPGTTREYVLENLECEEVEVELGEARGAEAIFLTSAGLGVTRVDNFDGQEMPAGVHPIQQLV